MYADKHEDTDLFFTILAEPRRRFTIRYLADHSSTTLSDITEAIATHEHTNKDTEPANLRQSVKVSMYQSHILKLDASDIVDYDDQSKSVTVGSKHQRAIDILEFVDQPY